MKNLSALANEIEELLEEVDRVDVDIIPAPSSSAHGQYLYVNCVWQQSHGESPETLLAKLRGNALNILRAINDRQLGGYWSLCLSFVEKKPTGGSLILYRAWVLKSKLPLLTHQGLAALDSEESRVPYLKNLIGH